MGDGVVLIITLTIIFLGFINWDSPRGAPVRVTPRSSADGVGACLAVVVILIGVTLSILLIGPPPPDSILGSVTGTRWQAREQRRPKGCWPGWQLRRPVGGGCGCYNPLSGVRSSCK